MFDFDNIDREVKDLLLETLGSITSVLENEYGHSSDYQIYMISKYVNTARNKIFGEKK